MKSKTIVSSLLALSLALSSYGVVMADTDSGDFASDSSVFSWVYNGEGILSISPTTNPILIRQKTGHPLITMM